jgi:hypothetical protein
LFRKGLMVVMSLAVVRCSTLLMVLSGLRVLLGL